MTEKQDYNPNEPNLIDTQSLLRGVETPPEGSFVLEDILAEYAADDSKADEPAPEAPAEPAEQPVSPPTEDTARQEWFSSLPRPSGETPEEGETPPPAPPESEEETPPPAFPASPAGPEEPAEGLDFSFWEDLLGEGGAPPEEVPLGDLESEPEESAPAQKREPPAPERRPAREKPMVRERRPAREEPPARGKRPVREEPPAAEEPPLSMEDIVATTVDAVKRDQALRQERLRQRMEKVRRKTLKSSAVRRKSPPRRSPEPAPESEPLPGEAAGWHKRRYKECRRSLVAAAPVLVLLWLPWVLAQAGVELPFFSGSADNAAVCVLVGQAAVSILCWPVFRAALEGLRERSWSVCTSALLSTVVTLLDEMTLLLLPQRTDAAPLGGIAAALSVFALWGLTDWHRGMAETLRTAAMGAPSHLADCCESGIAKGVGSLRGFQIRLNMEDSGTQWQRLLLPLLAAASVIFAVLASVGRGRGQDLLWCWSVILCAGSSPVFPLVFCVPFGRLAVRLSRSGAAVAGQYGASVLASSSHLVVTDTDLFPPGSAALSGLKLYGEERERAISYAATLAVQGGGLLGRIFSDLCRNEDIPYQELEHFHIHDDNGLSGMIRGETVLVGSAAFMRHKAVRLPAVMPGKTPVCLAVDGQLTAVFAVKYTAAESVSAALSALRRNGLQMTLASRDGNLTPKLLRARFALDGKLLCPELSERLALSDPEREVDGPNGILYRDGLLPFVSLVAGSRRLCQSVRVGNLLSVLGSAAGVLLGFYLTFTGSYGVLTPMLLLTYLLLWVVPMLPLVWGVDKL